MVHKERTVNAMLYAIGKYPNIGRTKLMKFFFFSDLINYNQNGDILLEKEYIRMPNGPVPESAFHLTGTSNAFVEVCPTQIDPEWTKYHFHMLREADPSIFSSAELSLFDEVIGILQSHSTQKISEITHRFSLWRTVADGDIIPLESFKLDEYEYVQLGSVISSYRAAQLAKTVEINDDMFVDDNFEVTVTA